MTASEVSVEENIKLYCRWRRFTGSYKLDVDYRMLQNYLMGVGEYTAVSEAMISASSWGLFGLESPFVFALSVVDSLLGEFDFFSSFNLFSRPSTLFRRASRTSVFGPRFFGTASVCCQFMVICFLPAFRSVP